MANVLITVCAMVVFVAVFHWGAVGLVVGNFTGTLLVYVALVVYRTEQLGLEFDRVLLRKMQKFGMPLVPSALALWTINWVDREFVVWYKGLAEVGVYSAAVKIASVITFVMIAFRTAWPAFAYSIEDDGEAKRTYAFVLTYLLAFTSWVALALGALAPWWTQLLTDAALPARREGSRAARVRRRGLRGLHGARDRQRPRAPHAAQLGRHGHRRCGERRHSTSGSSRGGAWSAPSISTAAAYVVLFIGMTVYAQHVYPVPYQWRRIVTALGSGVGLTVAARTTHLPLAPSFAARARVSARARRTRLLSAGGASPHAARLQSRNSMNVAPGTGLNRYGAISTKPSER